MFIKYYSNVTIISIIVHTYYIITNNVISYYWILYNLSLKPIESITHNKQGGIMTDIAVIILAAGMGTRMKSALPKVMHPIAGRPMINAVIATAESLSPTKIIAVVGPDMKPLEQVIRMANSQVECVVQHERLGTGHAVKQAIPALKDFKGDIVILYGDTPLIRPVTLQKMLARLKEADSPCVTVLGFNAANPAEYGRLITSRDNILEEIVEYREATDAQRAITLCNSGVIAAKAPLLRELLALVTNQNSKKEYYLTDIIGLARAKGNLCAYVEGSEQEVLGVNSRAQLAEAEAIVQEQMRLAAMDSGATLIQPETVTFHYDTQIGQDVTIHPYVVFGKDVRIEDNVQIKSFSHIEGAIIEPGAIVGPFARVRPHSVIHKNAHVGNFVEIKNTHLNEGAKANHLSYIGDSDIGSHSNIGAGTITCNYDGYKKSRTVLGENVFIGSNSALVAPLTIGNGAIIGAGSVITDNVPEGALAVARGKQVTLVGKGQEMRKRKSS
jgi:bifunctional UDP-N-acetylglucosamine pyrophosphorylase / glucosamine-1-phosphate N-acetyltransferase